MVPVSGNDAGSSAAELYVLPPVQFTAARNARAAELTGEAAKQVKALRKPTVAAWAVNLLVADGQLAQAIELSAALREAQEDLDAAELKQLSRQRRELVASLAKRAGQLVKEQGGTLSASAQESVAATINAAVMDERAAAAVLTGRLIKPLEAGDLDDLAGHVAGAIADVQPQHPKSRDDLAERRARKAAEAAAKAAERAASEAERALAKIEAQLAKAREHADMLHERAEDLRTQLQRVMDETDVADDVVDELETERKEAMARSTRARKEVERTQDELDD
ncbi:transposase [Microbacterium sp. GXF7504]